MMKKVAFAVLALVAGVTNAGALYNNGPVVDATGKSIVAPHASTYGYGVQSGVGNSVADDFNVTAGKNWNVTGLSFFGYQTGANGFSFTSATWSIVSGSDVNSGTVVASGTTGVTNGGLAGYRVTEDTLTDKQRAIYTVNADITDVTLASGHYWLTWGLAGSATPGPWQPPTSDARAGNAAQSLGGGAFATLKEPGSGLSVELPFAVNGTIAAVPEPETYAMLLGGLGLIGLARRRARRG
ncbi:MULTISPECIES: PEP-CTERM sorting domain-containing protein [unclassified Duganella]|uniref:PEP-CTERM sorting domain-containing protein n=1 Tax=unclassified Duganella TaxID=2636909 RepID=UPI000E345941|nr:MULTISPECIES: PEP-CTERM sorting domain-containing protein [unclassified Duganella]RFP18814.1 PEP-CTERM sorting domain-containing protein [Duganella sp. BJB475]RFP35479.1 PEP-CTERM sorting domain-containing protein [Duganella sp. BJB476]